MAKRRRSRVGGSGLTINEVQRAIGYQKFVFIGFLVALGLFIVILPLYSASPIHPQTGDPMPSPIVLVLSLVMFCAQLMVFVMTIMWANALRNLGCSFGIWFLPCIGPLLYWAILYDRTKSEASRHGLQIGLFGLSGRSRAELAGRSRGSRSRSKGASLGRKSKGTRSLGRKSKGTKSLGRKSKGSKLGKSKTKKTKREPTPAPEPAEDEIEVECPGCGEVLFVPEDVIGKTLRCGACKETFEVE